MVTRLSLDGKPGAQDMPRAFIDPFEAMADGFNSGSIDVGVPGLEPVAGTVTPAQVFDRAKRPER